MNTIRFNKANVSNYILETTINDLSIITFLQTNLDNDLILHDVNKYNFTYTVKERENSKTYEFPAILFETSKDDEDLNPQVDSQEKQENIITDFIKGRHKNKIGIWFIFLSILTIWFILLKSLDLSSANNLTTWPFQTIQVKTKTEIELLTDDLNKNNIENALLKEKKKQLLDELENLKNDIKTIDNKNSIIMKNINLLTD